MTAELAWYLVLCGLAFFYCFLNKRTALIAITYVIAAYYLWIVRTSGFDYDMVGYARYLTYNLDFATATTYYIREFVYWFGASYLYQMIQDDVITLWVIDMIWLTLLFYAMGNRHLSSKVPMYVIPFLIVFFPLLMGYQNVYRQLIACVFVLFAFFGARNLMVAGFFGLLALFTHNAAIVYMPLLYIFAVTNGMTKPKVSFFHKGVFAFLYLVMMAGVYYSSLGDSEFGKSSSSTGISLTYAYLAVFFAMSIVAFVIGNFSLKKFIHHNTTLVYSIFTFVAFIPALGGAQAERIGMMLLIVTMPIFAANLDRSFKTQNEKILMRMLFVMAGIAPTFLFSSAYNFLITAARLPG
ncbi:hypothetical protein SAMN05421848_3251 [Kushneria avicenniae]|uniref:EpsG family protein n=1 Tax=Kushneria avicenniae TaxID=402385 RepID=A0A1I1N0K3_9GAMM|nr:hypothetical protein [Kushneria avicenniae]SFC90955.1 hypothetical protein SAMN05421848_3251 [Kushneria avicenniae]